MPRLRRSFLRRYQLLTRRLFRQGLLLLAALLLCDGLALLCSSQIQAALSLRVPANQGAGASAPLAAPTSSQQVLAIDTFQRTNQTYWGTSSSGQRWQADANTAGNFSISHQAGVVSAVRPTLCDAVLGPSVADSEVTFSASLSRYNFSTLGAVLRWSDPGDFYKVLLNGQSLILLREVAGMSTPLQMVPFSARNGAFYTFRFSAVGSQLSVMVWPTGQPAPADWQISLSDSALSAGRAGISVLALDGYRAQVTTFMEVEA